MSPQDPQQPPRAHLTHAYDRMLERLKTAWQKASTTPLSQHLDDARQLAADLGELTREEADLIAEYLRRDLQDAEKYLSDSGRQLRDWLEFDLQFAENRLAELFANVVDQSRVELAQWEHPTKEWRTGEITGIGILVCTHCHEQLHFKHTGHIPPCPKCHGTVFTKRYADEAPD